MKRPVTAIWAILLTGMVWAAEPPDTLCLKNGTVLPCRITGIETDGKVGCKVRCKVRFRTPLIDGVASALSAHVKRLEMTATADEEDAGDLVLVLANGDRVAGDLVELTDDVIVLDSSALGEVEVPRPFVRCIVAAADGVGYVSSNFASACVAPWRVRTGSVSARDGALRSTSTVRDGYCVVSAPMKQTGAMTIQVEVDGAGKVFPRGEFWLYASDWDDWRYKNGIKAIFRHGVLTLIRYVDGRFTSLGSTGSQKPLPSGAKGKAIYTMTFDPESQKIKVWINAEFLGTFDTNMAMPEGRDVAIRVFTSEGTLRATVRLGLHTPTANGELPQDKGCVRFKNGDSLPLPRDMVIAGERIVIQTPDGEMRCPFDSIACIELPADRSAVPRRNKGDARVRVGRDTLTMQITAMTETTLRGRSDYLGAVRMPRKLVRSIEFDIYP